MASSHPTAAPQEVSLLRIFLVFAKIGAFTIGGGYAMIPIIEREMRRRSWIPEAELPDIVALSQSAPGLLAVNISIFAGYRLRGVKGSIAATLGSILPSFLAILLIAMLFTHFQDNPWVRRAFMGIRPAVIALIAVPMLNMARKGNRSWWAWCLSGAALVGVAFLGFSPIYIILVTIFVAVAVTAYRQRRAR